ncbi:MAG: hypothetical protein M0D57_08495 [Sphingobacteriales bacterium JAD_PAG50586_3]|nr:MAG: hypothetical protein M0D57_08495 [Sphingobacteriales bacterium JAD_PAG50586_3]
MKNIAIVLSLLICTLELSAQTSRTWTGSSSTDWNTAGNWSPSGVPSSSDHIILNTASGNQPVLDANRSITNITVSAGTIDVNGYTLTVTGSTNLTGGNINNGVLTFINTSTNISAMTIGAKVNITATATTITNSTFNKKLFVTQTSGAASYTWTGNTYNDTLDYRYTGSATSAGISFLNSTANGDVYVSTSNLYYISFGSGTISTNKFTLAANKRIKIGSSGWSSSASLYLNNVEFNDTNPFTISLSGPISIGSSSFSTAYGPAFNITAAYAIITNSTFNKKLLLIQTTGGNYICTGNTYNDTLDYRYTGSASNSGISFLNSAANGDVYVSATNQYYLYFGSGTISTNKFTLAANKRIKIGSSGWSSGALISLNNVEFNDTNPFTISLSGPISIGSSSFSTAYGPTFNITAAYAIITNSTFNKKLLLIQTTGGNYICMGNTYNDTLDYRYTGSASNSGISFLNSAANGDVYVSATNQYYLHFGSSTISTNKFTLAANKRIKIGSLGWSSGALISLNNVEFNDTNPFTISLSGPISIGSSSFSTAYGPTFNITAAYAIITNSTFNKKLQYTQTVAQNYAYGQAIPIMTH